MIKGRHAYLFLALLEVIVAVGVLKPLPMAAQDQILPLKIKVWEKAPDFVLPSADDHTIRPSDFAGHNALIGFYRGYW